MFAAEKFFAKLVAVFFFTKLWQIENEFLNWILNKMKQKNEIIS